MNNIFKSILISTIIAAMIIFVASSPAFSGTVSHITILDAYDDAYKVGGIIIQSNDDNDTILTTLELPYDPVKLCSTFDALVDTIIFTKPDHTTVTVDCSL